MNCDTAFELMTDPRGFRSGALEAHLASCPRCRQMLAILAPALDFLADQSESAGELEAGRPVAPIAHGSALATAEGVQIARQAAAELTARSTPRKSRLVRIAGHGLRYAAVFAAGIVLAWALVPTADNRPGAEGACTRGETLGNDRERSAAEVQALVASCVACHDRPHDEPAAKSGWLFENGRAELEWLAPLFADERLVAGVDRATVGNWSQEQRIEFVQGRSARHRVS